MPNCLTGQSFGLTEETVLSYCALSKTSVGKWNHFFYSYDNSIYPHALIQGEFLPASTAQFLKDLKRLDVFRVSQKSFPGLESQYGEKIGLHFLAVRGYGSFRTQLKNSLNQSAGCAGGAPVQAGQEGDCLKQHRTVLCIAKVADTKKARTQVRTSHKALRKRRKLCDFT